MNCMHYYNYFFVLVSAGVFHETFTSLRHIDPVVLYPIPGLEALNKPGDMQSDILPMNASTIFLSINRYERKKNLPLAIKSLGKSIQSCDLSSFHGYLEMYIMNREFQTLNSLFQCSILYLS
jgi:hypothetical protein